MLVGWVGGLVSGWVVGLLLWLDMVGVWLVVVGCSWLQLVIGGCFLLLLDMILGSWLPGLLLVGTGWLLVVVAASGWMLWKPLDRRAYIVLVGS